MHISLRLAPLVLVILAHSVLAQTRLGVVVAGFALRLLASVIVEMEAVLQCAPVGLRIMPMQVVLLHFQRAGVVQLLLAQVEVQHAAQDVVAQILAALCFFVEGLVCSQPREQQFFRPRTAVRLAHPAGSHLHQVRHLAEIRAHYTF